MMHSLKRRIDDPKSATHCILYVIRSWQRGKQNTERAHRSVVAEGIRSLVDRIEVRAGAKRGLTDVTLVGTLATILALGTNENARSTDATGGTFFLVAGVGFEPTTFRL
jgi:hypothetical protein